MVTRSGVLVVDSDANFRSEIEEALKLEGHRVFQANDLQSAERLLNAQPLDAVIAELRLRDGSGMDLVTLAQKRPEVPVVLLTAEYPDTREVVEAIRRGAIDLLDKPVFPERLTGVLRTALEERREKLRRKPQSSQHSQSLSRPPIIGKSPAVTKLLDHVARVAATPGTTVLIMGESGSGKELVARAVHFDGSRRDRPFMAINCAALNESILEAELFGYEKGAFTGAAVGGKKGLFESADGGTIFLDEIGEMSPALQAKLLRVLQENTFKRVGGVADISVDVRVIAATNRDLWEEVNLGRFRKDLYFRLNVMPIRVPALAERKEDILDLFRHFLERVATQMRKPVFAISKDAEERLLQHTWPGNVRELRNLCEYAVIVCDGDTIEARHLAFQDTLSKGGSKDDQDAEAKAALTHLKVKDYSLRSMEEELIRVVLSETRFNIARAARELGINRSTLYNKMRDYGLARELRQTV